MSKSAVSFPAALTRIIVVLFGVAVVARQIAVPMLLRSAGSDGVSPTAWVTLLAPLFFLWALWAASDVFARMHRGDAFGPAMVRGLRDIGGGLMLGAFAAIVVQPSLIFLIGNGFREMRGVQLDFDVENVTLALVGLVLVLLARYGRELQSKLDAFV